MQLNFINSDATAAESDALILPVGSDTDALRWFSVARVIDDAPFSEIRSFAEQARFSGRTASTLVIPTLGRLSAQSVILTGVGSQETFDADAVTRAVGAAVRAARDIGADRVAVALPDANWGVAQEAAIEAGAIGTRLGLYRFDTYKGKGTSESANHSNVESVTFYDPTLADTDGQGALRRAAAIADAVNLARDLSNEPGSTLTPETLAAHAREVAELSDLEIEILGPEELTAIGANAMLAVGGGSVNGPRLIRLRYRPEIKPNGFKVVGLVGKAITFDTGGYSIKTYEGMLDMKGDMSGGAAVLGVMSALRALECPVQVEATICAAENMISGTAFRPGDVIEGMNGVTMEILSTDAEGRLVLADGLVDAARRGATELIDLATLTGAAVVALGNGTTALFASDDLLANNLIDAAEESGERMWRMPLIEDLESKIKGDIADIKNTGGRAGGAITAALFLQHFIEGLPWAHLDIAGSARQEKASAIGPRGATGVGVRTLLRYLTT